MASIKRYKTAKGYAWRVQYRSPDGRNRTKQPFRTKDEAQVWAAANTVNISTGNWITPQDSTTKVETLAATWFSVSEHKPSWRARLQRVWAIHVQPKWGKRKVNSITQTEVRAWLAELSYTPKAKKDQAPPAPKPLSGSSKRHCLTVLAGALDIAVQEKMIHSNPARGFPLPKKAPSKKVFLTVEQLMALAEESTRPDIILTLGVTGLRFGELAGLQVQDIDLAKQRITIRRNAVWVDGETIVGTPKSGEQRTIIAPLLVTRALKRRVSGKPSDGWVFSDTDQPLKRPYSPGHWFQQAVSRAVDKGLIPDRVTLHDLRHTAASIMVSSGANVKVVQRQLGHQSAAMTLDTYAVLFDDDLDVLARRLDDVLPTNVVRLSCRRA